MNKPIDTAGLSKFSKSRIPPPTNFKVIGHLDRLALRWIAASPLMFAAFGDASGLGVTLGGGDASFAGASTYELRLPVEWLDDPALALPGQGFGALFLLPCVSQTMRVNGTVRQVRDGEIRIAVEECYGHSDEALIRSEFWTSLLAALAPQDAYAFAAKHRFMALATVDTEGRVEFSPKDDPAAILARIEAGQTCVSDRSGRFYGLAQPPAAALVLVLGSGQVARVSGNAWITADQVASARFVFRDEVSALAAVIEDAVVAIGESPTLLRLDLRSKAAMPLADHVEPDRDHGVGGELASAALSVPGVRDFLRKGLERSHKHSLSCVPS